MSKEKNTDLEEFQKSEKSKRNSHKSEKKTRFHSLITYATEKQIQIVLSKHLNSIRAFAYIYHDKDETEPHYHVVIRTHTSWSTAMIERWFKGLTDKEGEILNTFSQPVGNMIALEEYLTHADFESRQKGKHLYKRTEIKDHGLWDIVPKTESRDSSYDIVNDILCGMSTRQLVIRYGRDYVYHRNQYQDIVHEIRQDEGYKEAKYNALEYTYPLIQRQITCTDPDLEPIPNSTDLNNYFENERN